MWAASWLWLCCVLPRNTSCGPCSSYQAACCRRPLSGAFLPHSSHRLQALPCPTCCCLSPTPPPPLHLPCSIQRRLGEEAEETDGLGVRCALSSRLLAPLQPCLLPTLCRRRPVRDSPAPDRLACSLSKTLRVYPLALPAEEDMVDLIEDSSGEGGAADEDAPPSVRGAGLVPGRGAQVQKAAACADLDGMP